MAVAIVPALDEAPRVGRVVSTMPRTIDRIVVIDDGSRDETGAIARRSDARVEVLRNERSLGVGAAIARGCLHARSRGADAAVVLAGDGQMDPRDLDALLRPVLRDEADFAKGNRLAWPEGALAFPLGRLLGVLALSAMTRVATGLEVDDAQCGYVAFGPRALATIPWAEMWPSYGYPNELLSIAARSGLRVVEVPVRPVYRDEESKLSARHLPGVARVVAHAGIARAKSRPWRR